MVRMIRMNNDEMMLRFKDDIDKILSKYGREDFFKLIMDYMGMEYNFTFDWW